MTEVKEIGRFERMITFVIDNDAIEAGKRSAAARLARESKIKGFRPGKAPVKVVESMVGAETMRKEAIDDAIPRALAEALRDSELAPVVYPRLEEVRDVDDGVEVDVRITLWPEVDVLPDYQGRRVAIERPEVSDEDVDEQLERMRHQFAELEDVSREGFDEDFVLIDVKTTLDGEEYAAGSAGDMLYEIGSGAFLEGMDEALRGSSAGGILEFASTLPAGIGDDAGKEVQVRVLVKQVKAKRLPELTDDWVTEVSEFDTVAEMRTELANQIESLRLRGARNEFEQRLLAELSRELDVELPDALVEAEMDSVFHRFAHRLEGQGIEFEHYLQLTGQTQEAFVADLRSQADENLHARLLLETVADREGIEVEDSELEETIAALAAVARKTTDEYREALAEGDQEDALRGDILRRKAVDRLVELAVPVDADDNEIEFPEPIARPDEEDEGAGDGEVAPEPEPTEV